MKTVPVILAAGASTRMGTPKALLDFDGRCGLELILRTCGRTRAAAPIVVLGAAADRIRPVIPAGVKMTVNAGFRTGRTSSLKAGLGLLPPDADAFLLYPVDLPLVRADTVDRILAATGAIVVPVHGGQRGHPARFGRDLVAEFLALDDDEPAHRVVRGDPDRVVEIEVDDPGVVRKMNTPEEYLDGLRYFRAGYRYAGPA